MDSKKISSYVRLTFEELLNVLNSNPCLEVIAAIDRKVTVAIFNHSERTSYYRSLLGGFPSKDLPDDLQYAFQVVLEHVSHLSSRKIRILEARKRAEILRLLKDHNLIFVLKYITYRGSMTKETLYCHPEMRAQEAVLKRAIEDGYIRHHKWNGAQHYYPTYKAKALIYEINNLKNDPNQK